MGDIVSLLCRSSYKQEVGRQMSAAFHSFLFRQVAKPLSDWLIDLISGTRQGFFGERKREIEAEAVFICLRLTT